MQKSNTIFLLGGNGFVGAAFQRLLAPLCDLTVITRDTYAATVGKECDIFINANGNSKKFLAKDAPKEEFAASVASVRNSLVDFKCRKYVFLSTSDIYPDCSQTALTHEETPIAVESQSAYGFHKYLAELCVRHAAKDWLIIRQGGFVGPGMKKNAVYDILHGDKLWVHPDSAFQFIGTDESARLVMELVGKGVSNQIINLTARGTITARTLMALAGREIPHEAGAKPVHYEISTDKAAQWLNLPRSEDCVRAYLDQQTGS